MEDKKNEKDSEINVEALQKQIRSEWEAKIASGNSEQDLIDEALVSMASFINSINNPFYHFIVPFKTLFSYSDNLIEAVEKYLKENEGISFSKIEKDGYKMTVEGKLDPKRVVIFLYRD